MKMNMVAGRRSRGMPSAGDLFQIEMRTGVLVPGRVISTTVPAPGIERTFLLYLFKPGSADYTIGNLLLPPFLIVPKVWTMGYFSSLGNRPFGDRERYPRHCFGDTMTGFFDEGGNRVDHPFEPCIQPAVYILQEP